MEQPEKTEPTKTSSYNVSPTGGNTNVSDDLKQRVVEALNQDLYVDSTNITVHTEDNMTVELHGTVPERSMLKAAEECVRNLGVVEIANDLKIQMV
ncbi:MAG: BON domain-containing protein [Bdellovibrionota bacterium]